MNSVIVNCKTIGDGHPTYVIAEVGINHNSDVLLGKEMIHAAWECGADAVKLQTFITRDFLHPSHPDFKYDMEAELPHDTEQELWDYAKTHNINLFSTPEEFKSLEFIAMQNPSLIKIAAMDFNYQELIQRTAALQKPIVLSAGMSTLEEVLRAVRWVEESGNTQYIILHCVSCYPTPPQACNLRAIQTLKAVLGCPVGFSDHTQGIHVALAAASLGANVIEKHFTVDKKLRGPDQKSSADPEELSRLVRNLRDLEQALGHGRKEPAAEEEKARRYKRRGVYAALDLHAGAILKESDVQFFAPSQPRSEVTDWPTMKKRALKRDIMRMDPITLDDVV